jgi:hypothetical protein
VKPPPSPTGPERRRAERAAASFALRFGPPGQQARAKLKDISTLGLCCESPEPVPEMTRLRVDLEVPGSHQPFHAEGVVVRCDEIQGSTPGRHELAVYFTELDPAHRNWIAAYVAKAKPQSGAMGISKS